MIQKRINTEIEEFSDYESDLEESKMPRAPFRSADELIESKKRIYSHLRVLDRSVKPLPKNDTCLTLFIEPEDFLYFTFLCDENSGYIAKPTSKDPEHELFLASHRLPILFY
jgi:hypothetical protein